MNVFVINCGSSSIKYKLFTMPDEQVVCAGIVDRVGQEGSTIEHKVFTLTDTEIPKQHLDITDHAHGLREVVRLLTDDRFGVIADVREVEVVGHRVVHGGETFAETTVITDEVKAKIKELFSLAPLHNPPNYLGIDVAQSIFTGAKQIAVFDTAFHQTIPPVAFQIPIPKVFYDKHKIRNYGFHGTSHKYVYERAIEYLGKHDARVITVHLGNGCSMAAIKEGKSIDTSMGFGPMNGLIMGTRAGDLDQSVIFHLINELGYSALEVNEMLNKKSGMKGLTGFSDMRDISTEYRKGSKDARLAYEMYAYHIKKYIGAYAAVLNGLDAIVFTAGVGENDALTRSLTLVDLDYLGVALDEKANLVRREGICEIGTSASSVKILVIPTNEELEIARQCCTLLATGNH